MTGVIYKFTSKTTGKFYIGQTLKHRLKGRIQRHKTQIYDCHFYRARDKYGFDDFLFEILEEIDIKDLNNRESYWIAFYDSFNNGYNSTKGGDGGNTYAKRTKEQMDITKSRLSKSNFGCKNGMSKSVILINPVSKELKFFETCTAAGTFLGYNRQMIYRMKKKNREVNGWKIFKEGVSTIESVNKD